MIPSYREDNLTKILDLIIFSMGLQDFDILTYNEDFSILES